MSDDDAADTPARPGSTPATAPLRKDYRWLTRTPHWIGLVGGVIVAGFVGVVIVRDHYRWTAGHGIAFAALLLACAWGAAQLVDRVPRRPGRLMFPVWAALLWFLIVRALTALWPALGLDPNTIGGHERLLLIPPAIALLVALGRRLRTGPWVTGIAIFLLIKATASDPSGLPADGFVAAAGPRELAASLKHQSAPVIPSVTVEDGVGDRIGGFPLRIGLRCERVDATDQRRSLVGSPARRLKVVAEACWDANGQPFGVRLVGLADAGHATADPIAVRVAGRDPFNLGWGSRDDGGFTDDGRSPESHDDSSPTADRLFDTTGRVLLARRPVGPARVRVEDDGRTIQVMVGWLQRDPTARSSGIESDESSDADARAVTLGETPGRGEALDIFSATFRRAGDADAALVRVHHGGRIQDLAQSIGNSSVKPRPINTLSHFVLRGGE